MTVIAKILDSRPEGAATCYLSKMTLEEYLSGLPDTYQDYDIQRGIIGNAYLDHLVETVIAKNHIPPIVLLIGDGDHEVENDVIRIRSFKILDGLQRTYRLQAIRKTIAYCNEKIDDPAELLAWNKVKLSRAYSSDLKEINSNTSVLRVILGAYQQLGEEGLLETFSSNYQWFEVWAGLDSQQEVRKMLTLNAGHKSVSLKHQLELLFLNLLPILEQEDLGGFQVKREKEVNAAQFSKKRAVGDFLFAHLISSLLSFQRAKPVVPTQDLIQEIQSDDAEFNDYSDLMQRDFLREFVRFLVELDGLITEVYGPIGTIWMGREVTLAGLFGALGHTAKFLGQPRERMMGHFLNLVRENPGLLNLEQFEEVRNSLDLSKVNIGAVNRRAVFEAFSRLLATQDFHPIDWAPEFRGDQS